jgi:hypothetical protein
MAAQLEHNGRMDGYISTFYCTHHPFRTRPGLPAHPTPVGLVALGACP